MFASSGFYCPFPRCVYVPSTLDQRTVHVLFWCSLLRMRKTHTVTVITGEEPQCPTARGCWLLTPCAAGRGNLIGITHDSRRRAIALKATEMRRNSIMVDCWVLFDQNRVVGFLLLRLSRLWRDSISQLICLLIASRFAPQCCCVRFCHHWLDRSTTMTSLNDVTTVWVSSPQGYLTIYTQPSFASLVSDFDFVLMLSVIVYAVPTSPRNLTHSFVS